MFLMNVFRSNIGFFFKIERWWRRTPSASRWN